MRNNQPVSSHEFVIPNGVFIYSRTDLKGVITEANPAFAEISGFTPAEMIGQPHNLIRHPDMPPAAFADMWRNLKEGKPWKGIVKNRRKNGDFYWVVANASPVRENGQIVGYQSVRIPPSRAQIAAADAAYRRLRDGDTSIRVEDGRAVKNRSPLLERLLSSGTRLYGFAALMLFNGLLGLGATAGGQTWLLPWHEGLELVSVLAALYMLFRYLPVVFDRLRDIAVYLERALTSGDLTESLPPRQADLIGAIAGRIDTQLSAVRATLQIIVDAAREVGTTTGTLENSVARLSDATALQSTTATAAASAVEEMTVSIGEVAQHADSTQQVAEGVGARALEGAAQSKNATGAILTLAETVGRSVETIEQLGARTEEVGKVAGVIKEIADQTNLLALNAAIEAARAGEFGRGFAVVADEVRKLAERTASATREIDEMVRGIQGDTQTAVDGMRQSAQHVGQSVERVREAEATLATINEEMVRTIGMVSGISLSSSEQRAAMLDLARGVENVAQLTDGNLAIARNTGDVAQVLQRNVEKMHKAVKQYSV
jgi:aerotaxis receptor